MTTLDACAINQFGTLFWWRLQIREDEERKRGREPLLLITVPNLHFFDQFLKDKKHSTFPNELTPSPKYFSAFLEVAISECSEHLSECE